VRVWRLPAAHRIESDGRSADMRHSRQANGDFEIELGGERLVATVAAPQPGSITVVLADETCRLMVRDPLAPSEAADVAAARLTAPMPGKILAVHVVPGARVERGQLLMVLEAMKMEHAIAAPAEGVVGAVHYAAGDVVEEGALLLSFAAADRS
jgi:3-methylcrotonyl-CoA carboxylase alpha subunit